jgi:protein SCO1/2
MIGIERQTRRKILAILFVVTTIVAGIRLWYMYQPKHSQLPVVSKVPDFSFINENNQNFTLANMKGKVSIADFIFTSCAGTCPMMSTKMTELQQELANDPKIQFVSFSVDPETDTPEVLASYGKGYGAIEGKWIFLTGDKKKVYELTRSGFHLGLDTEGTEAIIHSQKFVLVDGNADIRGYYDSEDEEAMKKLIEDARQLQNGLNP